LKNQKNNVEEVDNDVHNGANAVVELTCHGLDKVVKLALKGRLLKHNHSGMGAFTNQCGMLDMRRCGGMAT
jgi:hypothetical protein